MRSAIPWISLLRPFIEDHFKAGVLIEMNVRRGQNHHACSMLNLGQLLRETRDMVVVHKRQRAHHRLIRVDRLAEQRLANQIANGFGRFSLLAPRNQPVELLSRSSSSETPVRLSCPFQ